MAAASSSRLPLPLATLRKGCIRGSITSLVAVASQSIPGRLFSNESTTSRNLSTVTAGSTARIYERPRLSIQTGNSSCSPRWSTSGTRKFPFNDLNASTRVYSSDSSQRSQRIEEHAPTANPITVDESEPLLSSNLSGPSRSVTPAAESGKLGKLIQDSIKATGPISIARYMQYCLGHPIEGYYTRERKEEHSSADSAQQLDMFGKKGDFITSPEISQLFGELIAVWFVMQWMQQGSAKKVRLIEMGPGRGTLLDDILRNHCGGHNARSLRNGSELLESSPGQSNWSEPDTFSIVLAHEFFDALPINVFQKTEDGWREVFVNAGNDIDDPLEFLKQLREQSELSESNTSVSTDPSTRPASFNASGLTLGLAREPTTLSKILPETSPRFADVAEGDRVEISSTSWQIMRQIGDILGGTTGQPDEASAGGKVDSQPGTAGGAALIVDYGDAKAFSNSFRAFRNHEIVHIFDDPGSADLTANVDFAYLKEAIADLAQPHGPITQRDFLIALGLGPRLDQLLKSAGTKERAMGIADAAKRLIDASGMGHQYKFLAVTPPTSIGSVVTSPQTETKTETETGDFVYPFDQVERENAQEK